MGMLGFYTLYYFICFWILIFPCNPINSIWEPWYTGKCIDTKIMDISAAYINLVIDTLILVLPQVVIWKLKLSLEKKIGVAIVFSIGVL